MKEILPLNQIICGNCAEVMKQFPNNSIDLTVTSPPYDLIRDYKGYTFNFKGIAKELYRVTKSGGVVVWVVADQTKDGTESGTSFKQALYFKEEVGFNLWDTMIYIKDGCGFPETGKRYTLAFEYMFILTKGNPKTFNPIKIRNKYFTRQPKISSTYRQRSGETINKIMNLYPEGRLYNVWYYSSGYMKTTKDKEAYKHPAMFPEKLVEDQILSWSNPGDIVLDPMIGSGTTAKMAILTERKYIGIDISEEYCRDARKRIKNIGNIDKFLK